MKTVRNAIFPGKKFFRCRRIGLVLHRFRQEGTKKQKRGRSENPSEAVPSLFEKSN